MGTTSSQALSNLDVEFIELSSNNYTWNDKTNGNYFVAVRDSDNNVGVSTVLIVNCDPEVPVIQCGGAVNFQGGQIYPSTQTMVFGQDLGVVLIDFEAYSVPDRLILTYDNTVVLDTGYRGTSNFNTNSRTSFRNALMGRIDPITGNVYPFSHPTHLSDGYPFVASPGRATFGFNKTTEFPTDARIDVYGPQSGTLWNYNITCPNNLTIDATDEVQITWTINYDLPTPNANGIRVFEGTIENGQLDGETDINWKIFMNPRQVENFLGMTLRTPFTSNSIRLGDNNSDSDDPNNTVSAVNIKGTQLFNTTPPTTLRINRLDDNFNDQTNPIKKIYSEIGFEHDNPNEVEIGEMVPSISSSAVSLANSMMRITFTPKLNKAELYRLFVEYSLQLSRN